MNAAQAFLATPAIEILGRTLLHFLWEGALLGVLVAAALRVAHRWPARVRYLLGCGAMLLFVAVPVATFFVLAKFAPTPAANPLRALVPALNIAPSSFSSLPPATNPEQVRFPAENILPFPQTPTISAPVSPPVTAPIAALSTTPSIASQESKPMPWQNWITACARGMVPFWFAGVLLMAARLGLGWCRIQFWRRRAKPARDPALLAAFRRLAQNFRLGQRVRLLISSQARGPVTFGWLKPVVLVPASLLTGLPRELLEALLAHELAHVARHDYLVNLFQSAIEIILFYHPAVWWLGARLRDIREECCDELALRACPDRLTYARALENLAQLQLDADEPAAAASGGSLLARIARILGRPQTAPPKSSARHTAGILILTALALLSLALLSLSSPQAKAQTQTAATTTPVNPPPSTSPIIPAETPAADNNAKVAEATALAKSANAEVEMQRNTVGGTFTKALDMFAHALELDPRNVAALSGRGSLRLIYLHDYQGAISDYMELIGADPNYDQAYELLALAETEAGHFDEAIADYTHLIDAKIANPGSVNHSLDDLYLKRGIANYRKGADLHWVNGDPGSGMVGGSIVRTGSAGNDQTAAMNDFSSAIKANPKNEDAYLCRGEARQRADDRAGAIDDFTTVINLNPKNAAAYDRRAMSERASGDLAGATADFAKARETAPGLLPKPLAAFTTPATATGSTVLTAGNVVFTGLGQLPHGLASSPRGVSSDGSVVAGDAEIETAYQRPMAKGLNWYDYGDRAFRWTKADGMTALFDAKYISSQAVGVSADGQTILGYGQNLDADYSDYLRLSSLSAGPMMAEEAFNNINILPDDPYPSFLWRADTGLKEFFHSDLIGARIDHASLSLTPDGQHVLYSRNNDKGSLWIMDVAPQSGSSGTEISLQLGRICASNDARVIAGTVYENKSGQNFSGAVILNWDLRHTQLGALPGDDESAVSAISADGNTIVGYSWNSGTGGNGGNLHESHPFRWIKATGMVALPTLSDGILTYPVGLAVSDDGAVVVGGDYHGGYGALFWDAQGKVYVLQDYLQKAGFDLKDWKLVSATAIGTKNGVYAIAGEGLHNGKTEAFVVTGFTPPGAQTASATPAPTADAPAKTPPAPTLAWGNSTVPSGYTAAPPTSSPAADTEPVKASGATTAPSSTSNPVAGTMQNNKNFPTLGGAPISLGGNIFTNSIGPGNLRGTVGGSTFTPYTGGTTVSSGGVVYGASSGEPTVSSGGLTFSSGGVVYASSGGTILSSGGGVTSSSGGSFITSGGPSFGPTTSPHVATLNAFGVEQTEDPKVAMDKFNHDLETDPRDASALSGRADLRFTENDYPGAISDYTALLGVAPTQETYDKRAQAEDQLGQFDEALADYTRAIANIAQLIADYNPLTEVDPGFLRRQNDARNQLFIKRGIVRDKKGDQAGAGEDFTAAIQADPESETAYLFRGEIRKNSGNTTGAMNDFDTAINLNPKDAAAYLLRALTERAAGDPAKAAPDFAQARAIAGPTPKPLTGFTTPAIATFDTVVTAGNLVFTGLGQLPHGLSSSPRGVSADGSVVVGNAKIQSVNQRPPGGGANWFDFGDRAFRWTKTDGLTALFDEKYISSQIIGISEDGRAILGYGQNRDADYENRRGDRSLDGNDHNGGWINLSNSLGSLPLSPVEAAVAADDPYPVFFWHADTGLKELHDYGVAQRLDHATLAFTADGQHVLIRAHDGNLSLWKTDGGLNLLPPAVNSLNQPHTSGDGRVIAGTMNEPISGQTFNHAVRWSATDGLADLGAAPGDDQAAVAAMSADGNTIIGYSWKAGSSSNRGDFPANHLFRWTKATGLVALPMLSNGILLGSTNLTVSDDGALVVGGDNGSGGLGAVFWDAQGKVYILQDYLQKAGLDLRDWTLGRATAIGTKNGVYAIAGEGQHNGKTEAFVVTGFTPYLNPAETETVSLPRASAKSESTADLLIRKIGGVLWPGWTVHWSLNLQDTLYVERSTPLQSGTDSALKNRASRTDLIELRVLDFIPPAQAAQWTKENEAIEEKLKAMTEEMKDTHLVVNGEVVFSSGSELTPMDHAYLNLRKQLHSLPDYSFEDISLDWATQSYVTTGSDITPADPAADEEYKALASRIKGLLTPYAKP